VTRVSALPPSGGYTPLTRPRWGTHMANDGPQPSRTDEDARRGGRGGKTVSPSRFDPN